VLWVALQPRTAGSELLAVLAAAAATAKN
jgi:hypothetical protein